MKSLSFDHFAEFIRDFARISASTKITPNTEFEKDLKITGDDGVDLLQETEKRFSVKLSSGDHGYKKTFNLGPNEYLFDSEGLDLIGIIPLLQRIFGKNKTYTVRRFTVGELFDAVCRNQKSDSIV